ncbi:MAG: glycosyltransferase family 2 protein [Natronospirillum sp.]
MSNLSKVTVSVVVPLYNEVENVGILVDRITESLTNSKHAFEILLVNDGSQDGTFLAMQAQRDEKGEHIKLIDLSRNYGQTAAMQAGIDYAEGSIIVTMDGDLQNDPSDIPKLIDELLSRDLDLVQGWRMNRKDGLVLRKIPSKIANWLIGKITGLKLHDYGCSLKVYRAEMIKQVRLYGEMHRFIPVWATSVTSPDRIGEIPVKHHSRQFGESKYGISRTFRVILDLISVFFFQRYRARPSHFFGIIGLVFGTLGGIILAYLFSIRLVLGVDIGDRPLLIGGVLLVMISMQFITTGVIAEMLSRIYFSQDAQGSYYVSKRSSELGAFKHANQEPKTVTGDDHA